MLFGPGILIAGSVTILVACLDRTLEEFGFHLLGTILKIAIPLATMLAGVYFLETNALLGWLR